MMFWRENGLGIRRQGDSVFVEGEGKRLAGFKLTGGRVAGPIYKEYYPEGGLKRLDSVSTQCHAQNQTYPAGFAGCALYSYRYTPAGLPESANYYTRNGEDSLRKSWYANGILRETVWSSRWGTDSLTYTWNNEGILSRTHGWGSHREYYPAGTLQYEQSYVTVDGYRLLCRNRYYDTGIRQATEYYYADTPCHVWSYYRSDGTLEKTERKRPFTDLTEAVGVAEAREPEIFRYVEQLAEFPGGEAALAKYMNARLNILRCESRAELRGTYRVLFSVDQTGTPEFKGLEGRDAADFTDRIRSIFAQMPRWKPSKFNGRAVGISFVMQMVVKERPKQPKP